MLGFVSMNAATSSSSAALSASTSTWPRSSLGIVTASQPHIVTDAGIRAVRGVGDDDLLARRRRGRVRSAEDHERGQLAVRAGSRLQRHAGQAR